MERNVDPVGGTVEDGYFARTVRLDKTYRSPKVESRRAWDASTTQRTHEVGLALVGVGPQRGRIDISERFWSPRVNLGDRRSGRRKNNVLRHIAPRRRLIPWLLLLM